MENLYNNQYYGNSIGDILGDIESLVPCLNDPLISMQRCDDVLRGLLEIRDFVNFHVRTVRKELKLRKLAGYPVVDNPASGLPEDLGECLQKRMEVNNS
ncbi:MAG: hypothetical protein ABSH41_14260 [Syntrophobacteraceae bacterium]